MMLNRFFSSPSSPPYAERPNLDLNFEISLPTVNVGRNNNKRQTNKRIMGYLRLANAITMTMTMDFDKGDVGRQMGWDIEDPESECCRPPKNDRAVLPATRLRVYPTFRTNDMIWHQWDRRLVPGPRS